MSLDFSALIAGVTITQEDVVRQLLLYCSRVISYRPVEGGADKLPAGLADLAPAYAPAPLGESLAKFQGLLADITRHRADYRLGGIAALAAPVDQEGLGSLISGLRPSSAPAAQDEEALLQARLLLALAELHDQEEREIAVALAALEGQGQALLRRLAREDEEGELCLPGRPSAVPRPETSQALASRLRAWALLFLADRRQADHWLLSASPEVWGLLADYASGPLGPGPGAVLSLPLPAAQALTGLPLADYRQVRDDWQSASQAPRQAILSGLLRLVAGDRADFAPAQAALVQLQQGHPLWAEAPARLDFHLLPLSLADLMAKIARRPASPPNDDRHPRPYGVVAVVTTDVT